MTQNTSEQDDLLKQVKYPPRWFEEPVSLTASPFPFYQAYTNPAFLNSYPAAPGMIGHGSLMPFGDGATGLNPASQFTSALTQPTRKWSPDLIGQSGGCACQNGSGIKEVAQKVYHYGKKAHDFIKEHKLASKAIRQYGKYKGTKDYDKYADLAERHGYGKYRAPIQSDPSSFYENQLRYQNAGFSTR